GSWNRILFIYGRPTDVVQKQAAVGMAAFWRYAEGLVESRQKEPREDFISDLVHAQDADGLRLTLPQAATIVLDLLFAGHETTTGLLGNAFRRLLADRPAWQAICQEPALIPNAVEEVLRLDSSVIAWRRRTTQAVVIGGVSVPADAGLLLMLGAANRDPTVFPHPHPFHIPPANAHAHLSLRTAP